MPRLFVLSGPDVGSALAFEGTVVLGREKGADLVVHAPSVSRKHARLEERGGHWFVVDLGSSNGTHVGGERVSEAELSDGALFRLGDLELRFRSSSDVEARHGSPRSASPLAPSAAPPATSPAVPAPIPSPPPGPSETGEIELEGEWGEALAPAPPRAFARSPLPPSASPTAPRASSRPPPPTAAEAARIEAARTAPSAGGERATAGGGRILQYHKQERRSGLFTTDFGQQPAWIRWGAILVLAAFAVALAWGAFEFTRSLRERGEPSVIEQPPG